MSTGGISSSKQDLAQLMVLLMVLHAQHAQHAQVQALVKLILHACRQAAPSSAVLSSAETTAAMPSLCNTAILPWNSCAKLAST